MLLQFKQGLNYVIKCCITLQSAALRYKVLHYVTKCRIMCYVTKCCLHYATKCYQVLHYIYQVLHYVIAKCCIMLLSVGLRVLLALCYQVLPSFVLH